LKLELRGSECDPGQDHNVLKAIQGGNESVYVEHDTSGRGTRPSAACCEVRTEKPCSKEHSAAPRNCTNFDCHIFQAALWRNPGLTPPAFCLHHHRILVLSVLLRPRYLDSSRVAECSQTSSFAAHFPVHRVLSNFQVSRRNGSEGLSSGTDRREGSPTA
jgi:hypothetical protein